METKKCNICELEKPLDGFHNDAHNKTGKYPTCKNCCSLRRTGQPYKEVREKNKAKEFDDDTKLCSKCGEIKNKSNFYYLKNLNRHRSCCRECESNAKLKRDFKLSPEELVDIIVKKKTNICEICGGSNINGKKLSLDHNHDTGKLRGILCDNCNLSIGLLKDNIEVLNNAIKYLEKHK